MKKAEGKTATKVATQKKVATSPATKKTEKIAFFEKAANAAEIHAAESGNGKAMAAALKATAELKPARLAVFDTDRKRANRLQDALKAAGIDSNIGREKGGSQVYVDADKFDAATKILNAPVATAPATEPKVDKAAARAAKDAAKAAKKAERAAKRENSRITPGTPLKEWRVVKSQRVGRPGYFLQGGVTKPGPKGPKSFFVGQETLYKSLDEANKQLDVVRPPVEPAAKVAVTAPAPVAAKKAPVAKKGAKK